jgi:hypothetical protein
VVTFGTEKGNTCKEYKDTGIVLVLTLEVSVLALVLFITNL